jgi:hypothetical protein
MGCSPDYLSIIGSWVREEAALEQEIAKPVEDSEAGTSLLFCTVMMAPDVPRGRAFASVFFRYRGAHREEPHFEVGVQLRSLDSPNEPPVNVVFGTMETIEGGLIAPAEDVDPAHAVAVGTLAMRKNNWASYRGLELTEDATGLVLPAIPFAAVAPQ